MIKSKQDPSLVSEYLKHCEWYIQEILTSLGIEDFLFVQNIGKQLKESGRIYGFDKITKIGANIESEAKEKSITKLPELTEELSSYLRSIKATLT